MIVGFHMLVNVVRVYRNSMKWKVRKRGQFQQYRLLGTWLLLVASNNVKIESAMNKKEITRRCTIHQLLLLFTCVISDFMCPDFLVHESG